MRASTSSVSLGSYAMAPKVLLQLHMREAPVMTLLTRGLCAAQAMASWCQRSA